MNFIFLISLITGVSLLSYYGVWDALTLTGGWAWLGLLCIIYFIGDILEEIGKWLGKHKTTNNEQL